MDHTALILRAEALASEFPHTNITLQNVRPSAVNHHYKRMADSVDMMVRQYRNGSCITVSVLPF